MASFFDRVIDGYNRLKDWANDRRVDQTFEPEQGEITPPQPRKAQPRPDSDAYTRKGGQTPYRDDAPDEADAPPSNVLPFPGQGQRASEPDPASTQVFVYYARHRGDCEEIINLLLQGRMVVLNLEALGDAEYQRVIDLVSGASFSLRATVNPLSYHNYLLAPAGVQVERNMDAPPSNADLWQADDRYDRRDPYDRGDRRSSYGSYGQDDAYARNRRYAAR
ncbi:MAG: cell division protein SepF [Oscillospiraceae bacterium]|jgi:FtsZ-interacting cell division protein YlmF|nr:cell division protein SepF [Oscillospiraceae bacterium]